jgi:hypothetical protein
MVGLTNQPTVGKVRAHVRYECQHDSCVPAVLLWLLEIVSPETFRSQWSQRRHFKSPGQTAFLQRRSHFH